MYLIVGLGNPGNEFNNTRHNVGFEVIDLISDKYNIPVNRIKFKGMYGEGVIAQEKVILLKPQTYMNLSGESVSQVCNFYKIPNENIIVIYDDISLQIGRMRIRGNGSSGGHNGIKNIILHLSSEVFPRIKVGVGQPQRDLVGHVLGRFSKEERDTITKVFNASIEAVEEVIKNDINSAMNKYNGFKVET